MIAYFRSNFENTGIIVNSIGFSVTISLLVYGMFNKPKEVRPAVEAALYAFPFILFFLFLTHHFILRLKICNPEV